MAKRKKLTATQKERKRIQQFIRRAEKRGYEFAPELKEKVKTAKYQTLHAMTPGKLYKQAEYYVPKDTGKYIKDEVVSGTTGRRLERQRASELGRLTQISNKVKREGGYTYTGKDGKLHWTANAEKAKDEQRKSEETAQQREKQKLDEFADKIEQEISYDVVQEERELTKEKEPEKTFNDEVNQVVIVNGWDDLMNEIERAGLDYTDFPKFDREKWDEIQDEIDDKKFSDELYNKFDDFRRNIMAFIEGYTHPEEYDDYDWWDATEPPEYTDQHGANYESAKEAIDTVGGVSGEILDGIVARAIERYGEDKVIDAFDRLPEQALTDMQLALYYDTETHVNSRKFREFADALFNTLKVMKTEADNRAMGDAMDSL